MKKLSTEEFIQRAKQKYSSENYDYSKVEYINSRSKVCIICPKHGEFWKQANSFLKDSGCPSCGLEQVGLRRRDTLEDFIKKANKTHGNKYDYSKVVYTLANNKVEIICPIHGSFMQKPGDHIHGRGCPRCNDSKGERIISTYFQDNQINYIPQYKIGGKFKSKKFIKVDFYLPDVNYIVEYNGRQHYMPVNFKNDQSLAEHNFILQQKRDQELREYCLENNINLLEIPYNLNEDQVILTLNNVLK